MIQLKTKKHALELFVMNLPLSSTYLKQSGILLYWALEAFNFSSWRTAYCLSAAYSHKLSLQAWDGNPLEQSQLIFPPSFHSPTVGPQTIFFNRSQNRHKHQIRCNNFCHRKIKSERCDLCSFIIEFACDKLSELFAKKLWNTLWFCGESYDLGPSRGDHPLHTQALVVLHTSPAPQLGTAAQNIVQGSMMFILQPQDKQEDDYHDNTVTGPKTVLLGQPTSSVVIAGL